MNKTNINTNSDYKTNFGKKQTIALDLLVTAEHEGKIDLKGIRDEIATLTFGVSIAMKFACQNLIGSF